MRLPLGTLVNVATVILGSTIGLLLRKKFPAKVQAIIFESVGLGTLVLGMQMAFKVQNFLIFIFSLILGGILGEVLHLDQLFEAWGDSLKGKIKAQDARFTEGLITAFLIFCVGSMTIMGALNEGLTGDHSLLLIKSVLDGFTSIALASVYGLGVMFSTVPLFILQAGLTLLAMPFQDFFSTLLIDQLTAVGGTLILGIGLSLLNIKAVKTINLLPGLGVVIVLTVLFG